MHDERLGDLRRKLHLLQRETFIFQADIAEVWDEYQRLVEKAEFDSKGRTVVNIRWIIGKEEILPMMTLRKTILLKRGKRSIQPNINT
ncbi:MAG: hypothetical protein QXH51_08030 [Candidatus Bathyarchaeia archaeon]